MSQLDPGSVPLRGQQLIEASAGTGKTFTLTTLYLRLLLEAGLEVPRILVVTFTEAATEELRDRIRSRLRQALASLESPSPAVPASADPELARSLAAAGDPASAARRVAAALASMDEASIHTIHGFCQRVLAELAFDSGVPFQTQVIAEESALRQAAAADFWRCRVATASPSLTALARALWRTPAGLLAALGPSLALEHARVMPAADPAAVAAACDAVEELFGRWQGMWRARGGEAAAMLRESAALDRRRYPARLIERVLRLAEELAGGTLAAGAAAFLRLADEGVASDFERLTAGALARATRSGHPPPRHPSFELAEELAGALRTWRQTVPGLLLAEARRAIRDGLERRKRDERLLYFDDLLRRVAQALEGEAAEPLAARLRARYPAALIDEFQDTDPLQYRIFRRVYQGHPECALVLVGDPKQAIYGFRGADIFTYAQARVDTPPARRFTLATNRRASAELVRAVNALFGGARQPFVLPAIEFTPAAAAAATAPLLLIDGEEPVPLQFWRLPLAAGHEDRRHPECLRVAAAEALAARACARRIAYLLNRADAGRARLGERPLAGGDVAVLVRTHREAGCVQQALRECGVRSVTLSQDSVFGTEEAEELAVVLAAVAAPADEGRVRAALATTLLGHDAPALEQLAAAESAWEQVLERFERYHRAWRDDSFMASFQTLLSEERIAARLRRLPDGDRRLTNLLQLGELLQEAAAARLGMEALRRWLSAQRAEEEVGDARQLRLESDEGLVQVVTMHKSKGLGYAVVFVPFPWSWSAGPQRGPAPPLLFHDPRDGSACLDLGSPGSERHQLLVEREQLAERVRLLYVAVTRAARLCVLCWGPVSGAEHSALAYLLRGGAGATDAEPSAPAPVNEAAVRAELTRLADQAPGCILVQELPHAEPVSWRGRRPAPETLALRVSPGRIDSSWRVHSYSGLLRGQPAERPDYDALPGARAAAPAEARAVPPGERPSGWAPGDEVFGLPAGADTGIFVHALLRELDFPGARGEALAGAVRRCLDACGPPGAAGARAAEWALLVGQLVGQALDTGLPALPPLAGDGPRLRDLARPDRLDELEFHFPVQRTGIDRLRQVLARAPAYAAAAEGLGVEVVHGLMRGFVDLVFRWRGRYYVADYKSNHLGDSLADYASSALESVMRQHRYDLQALLYTVAVHRYLRQRLRGYRYNEHFGGVYYLFLRGLRPHAEASTGVWADRPDGDLVEQLDRLFGSTAAGG